MLPTGGHSDKKNVCEVDRCLAERNPRVGCSQLQEQAPLWLAILITVFELVALWASSFSDLNGQFCN